MFLTSTLLTGAPAITITELRVLHFGLVCSLHGGVYARASNMHAVTDVSSYYLAYSDEEVVSSDPNNSGSKRIVRS